MPELTEKRAVFVSKALILTAGIRSHSELNELNTFQKGGGTKRHVERGT